jgi:methionyl-tRNA formyltransferase
MNGQKETGTSLFLVDAKVDHGPILSQRGGVGVDNKYFEEVVEELAEVSAKLFLEVLPDFASRSIKPIVQDESLATFTKKITTEDGFIEDRELNEARSGVSEEKALKIDRLVRALNPDPGVYTVSGGKRMKILKGRIENGRLLLEVIQWEGRKPINIKL